MKVDILMYNFGLSKNSKTVETYQIISLNKLVFLNQVEKLRVLVAPLKHSLNYTKLRLIFYWSKPHNLEYDILS